MTKQAVPSVVRDYPWKLWYLLSGSGPQWSGSRLQWCCWICFLLPCHDVVAESPVLSRCVASCIKCRGSEREGSPTLAAVMQISKKVLKSTVPIHLACPPSIPALSAPISFQWGDIQKDHNILHKEIQGQRRALCPGLKVMYCAFSAASTISIKKTP